VTGALHEPIPEVASVPVHAIETAWLYQPSWSAGRPAVTVTSGGVASYWSPKASGVPVFPAASVHEPCGAAFASSGPVYVSDEHAAMPDVTSLPCQSIRTGASYQPSWSGGRALGVESAGGVASYLTT
jgi:hypothetical protein